MLRTKEETSYKGAPCTKEMIIPAHAPVIEATNLPGGGYWVEPWAEEMPEIEDSWIRNYGFHLEEHEVEDVDGDLVLGSDGDIRIKTYEEMAIRFLRK